MSGQSMIHQRIILGLIALIILIISMIYSYGNYESNAPTLQKYGQFFEHPASLNNTEISFRAEILAYNRTNHTLRVFIQEQPYTYPQVYINIRSLPPQNLTRGDLIDVIGIIHGNKYITATRLWLDEPWKEDLIYLRSLPAIPFVLYLFLRTWTFNRTTYRFERRQKHA